MKAMQQIRVQDTAKDQHVLGTLLFLLQTIFPVSVHLPHPFCIPQSRINFPSCSLSPLPPTLTSVLFPFTSYSTLFLLVGQFSVIPQSWFLISDKDGPASEVSEKYSSHQFSKRSIARTVRRNTDIILQELQLNINLVSANLDCIKV